MRFLIDTNVISETRRARADRRVEAWLDLWPDGDLALSVVTLGEIQEGITRLDAGAKRTALIRWLEEELAAQFGNRVLPVNVVVARERGASLEKGAAPAGHSRQRTGSSSQPHRSTDWSSSRATSATSRAGA